MFTKGEREMKKIIYIKYRGSLILINVFLLLGEFFGFYFADNILHLNVPMAAYIAILIHSILFIILLDIFRTQDLKEIVQ